MLYACLGVDHLVLSDLVLPFQDDEEDSASIQLYVIVGIEDGS